MVADGVEQWKGIHDLELDLAVAPNVRRRLEEPIADFKSSSIDLLVVCPFADI